MFGLVTSIFSIASIAYPFYKTLDTLLSLQSAYSANAVSAITDTVILQRKESINIQETVTYWILLSFWFYFLNLSPISFLVRILPFSSLTILYIQIWLGFPIIPVGDKKISGSSMIYHYYFDNNMKHLMGLKNQCSSIIGNFGIKICQFINTIPKAAPILTVLGINLELAEQYFTQISRTKNNSDQGIELVGMFSSIFVNCDDDVNNDTLFTIIISSLVSPFGYAIREYNSTDKGTYPTANANQVPILKGAPTTTPNNILLSSQDSLHPSKTNQSIGNPLPSNDSTTPSPARSFDDFAIVSEKDLLVNDDLNATMRRSKRGSPDNEPTNPAIDDGTSEKSSLLDSVRHASGSRHSSWFSRR